MPAQPINMQQIKRILQMFKSGYTERSIHRHLCISRPTIAGYKLRFKELNQSYDQLLQYSDEELSNLVLGPVKEKVYSDKRYLDLQNQIPMYLKELKRVGVTRHLLWEEYKLIYFDGYGYSQFCLYLQSYIDTNKSTMHLEHTPGEIIEVDFAGKTIKGKKPDGEIIPYQVFVAILPFSGYTYIEAVKSQNQSDFLNCMQNMLVYFGGVTQRIVSDNLKSCVTKPDRYEPILTALMDQFCIHYDTVITPARVRKPKDKPSVERSVDLAYERVYAPLRDKEFFSLKELNNAILLQLDKHHQRKFRHGDQTRSELFLQIEKQTLKALPAERMQMKKRINAKVQKNYHVFLGEDRHFYSVPNQYLGKEVVVIYTTGCVEIYLENKRIALHQRNQLKNGYTTETSHMPPNHNSYAVRMGWSGDYFRNWASRLSKDLVPAIDKMLGSRQHIEQAFRGCNALLLLQKAYGTDRLVKACQMALRADAVRYKLIEDILINNRDKALEPEQNTLNLFGNHENIRGPESFNL